MNLFCTFCGTRRCVQWESECHDVKTLICYNQWRQQEHNKCWYKLFIVDLLQRLIINQVLRPPHIFLLTVLWQFTYAALFDSSWFKVPMPLASWLKVSKNYGTTSETIAFIKNWNHWLAWPGQSFRALKYANSHIWKTSRKCMNMFFYIWQLLLLKHLIEQKDGNSFELFIKTHFLFPEHKPLRFHTRHLLPPAGDRVTLWGWDSMS